MNNMVQFDQATNNKLRSEAPVQVGKLGCILFNII
ncbi:unnamed protein product [Brassica oleracea var. botrytis]